MAKKQPRAKPKKMPAPMWTSPATWAFAGQGHGPKGASKAVQKASDVSGAARPGAVSFPIRPKGRWKAWGTILVLLAAAAAPYFVPGLEAYQPLSSQDLGRTFLGPWQGHPKARLLSWKETPELAAPPVRPAASLWADPKIPLPRELRGERDAPGIPRPVIPPGFAVPPGTVEDYGGAMEPFYAALLRTANREPGAITRIAHFGDSPLTGDLISGEARTRFQKLYGDAGHGFLLAGKPWEWYGHLGASLDAGGWRIFSPFLAPPSHGPCGLGGTGFASSSSAAHTTWGTAKQGPGASASCFEIHFLGRPGGGTLLAFLDGDAPMEISTASPLPESLTRILRASDGPHRLTLRPKGDGEVVLFGAAIEREGPGVVYDALGANGASIHGLAQVEEGPWEQSLALRRPDLVILQYGTNESSYAGTYSASYRKDFKGILRRIRLALPRASILIMAPMDRGERNEFGEIVTVPGIVRIVRAQRAIAREEGCAFFDTFQAMGGEGTMARWYEREHPLVSGDLTHPSRAGSDIVARLLVDAVEEAFHAWIAGREPAAPPTSLPPADKTK